MANRKTHRVAPSELKDDNVPTWIKDGHSNISALYRSIEKDIEREFHKFIAMRLFEIHHYHPEVEIEKYSVREDHIHVVG
jgi:hypothetical protein